MELYEKEFKLQLIEFSQYHAENACLQKYQLLQQSTNSKHVEMVCSKIKIIQYLT